MTNTDHQTIYWLMGETGQKGAGLTWNHNPSWLSVGECDKFHTLRFEKRRMEWLLGRLTAKNLLTRCVDMLQCVDFTRITIANRPDGAPYVCLDDKELPLSISLSHRQDMAGAAVTLNKDVQLGIDLEWIEARDASFYEDYLTSSEYDLLGSFPMDERAKWGTLIWSAKESMLKALGQGLRVDTRSVQILRIDNFNVEDWQRLDLHTSDHPNAPWQGYWRQMGNHVLTLAIMGAISPIEIQQIQFEGDSLS